MLYNGIIKRLNIRNSDTDSYITLSIELDNNNIDVNYLNSLKHKALNIEINQANTI